MIEPRADRPRAITLGADKAYDAEDFVNELRSMTVTPHVAQDTSGRSSAIDARTTRHGGYASVSASASASKRRSADQDGGQAGEEKFRGAVRGWAFTSLRATIWFDCEAMEKVDGKFRIRLIK